MKLSTLLLLVVLAWLLLAPAPGAELAPIRVERESYLGAGPAPGPAAVPALPPAPAPLMIVRPRSPLLDRPRSRFLV